MSAAEILSHLRADGLTLSANDGRLLVEPRDLITDAHRSLIRTHKPELLALLSAANDDRHRAPDPVTPPFKRWRITVQHGDGQRSFDMLTPAGRSASDAKAAARFHFTDRLIAVTEATTP